MNYRLLVCWICVITCSASALAQDASEFPLTDKATEWSVTVHPERIFQLEAIDQVVDVITDGEGAEMKRLMERYQDVIGLDPTTDIREVHLQSSANVVEFIGEGLQALVQNSVVSANLKSTGNLEGLVLVAPRYDAVESKTRGTLHRFELDGQAVFVHFSDASEGSTVVAGFNDHMVTAAVKDHAGSPSDGKPESGADGILASCDLSPAAIRKVVRMEEWEEHSDDATTVVQRVLDKTNHMSARVSAKGNKFQIEVNLYAKDAAGAKQIHQLARAGAAMLKVAIAEEDDDSSELRAMLKLADGINIRSEGKEINASVDIDDLASVIQVLGEL